MDFEAFVGKRPEVVTRTELKAWETSRCGGNYKNAKATNSYGPLCPTHRLRWPSWLCENHSIGRNQFSPPWEALDAFLKPSETPALDALLAAA